MNRLLKSLLLIAAVCLTTAVARADYYFYFTQNTGMQTDTQAVADISDYVMSGPYAPATDLYIDWPYQLRVWVDTDSASTGFHWVGTVAHFSTWHNVYVIIQ